jgi:integration host factor subunit beta
MTRSKLIERLAAMHADAGLERGDFERVVKGVFAEISEALVRGDRVELRGFGVLSVRPRKPRVSRNPRTGVAVQVGHKHQPHFKTSRKLHQRLNSVLGPLTD